MFKLLSLIGSFTLGVTASAPLINHSLIEKSKIETKAKQIFERKMEISQSKNNNQYPGIINDINNMLINNKLATKLNEKNKDGKNLIRLNNNSETDYFKIKLSTDTVANKSTSLIINVNNLYLEGFISNGTYFHFSDSVIKELGPKSKDLGYSGNYNSLIGASKLNISKQSINQSIANIVKLENVSGADMNIIKPDLVTIITLTSESMRFFSVRNTIYSTLNGGAPVEWQKQIKGTVVNWDTYSKKYDKGDKTDALNNISLLNKVK